jgi:hypothetical protein
VNGGGHTVELYGRCSCGQVQKMNSLRSAWTPLVADLPIP